MNNRMQPKRNLQNRDNETSRPMYDCNDDNEEMSKYCTLNQLVRVLGMIKDGNCIATKYMYIIEGEAPRRSCVFKHPMLMILIMRRTLGVISIHCDWLLCLILVHN